MKSRKAARSKAVASPPKINSYNADSDKKLFLVYVGRELWPIQLPIYI